MFIGRSTWTFARESFERQAVVDERALIRDGLRRGMGEITHAQVRANLDVRMASGEFQNSRTVSGHSGPPVHHRENHRSRA